MDDRINKAAEEISRRHREIIDDWCKAYLAQLYEEGVDIKPGCFTLNEQHMDSVAGSVLGKRYWFEKGVPNYSNWKDIETAPEDKTDILACSTTGRIYIINFDGKWHNMPDLDFTHWMPLPEPPK